MKQPCICYSMNSCRDSARGISIQIEWLNDMEGNRTMGFSKQWKHNVNETFRPPWVVIWWHNSYSKCSLQNTIVTNASKYLLRRYCKKKGTYTLMPPEWCMHACHFSCLQNNFIMISPFLMPSEWFFSIQNDLFMLYTFLNDFPSKMYFCFDRFILYLQEGDVSERYDVRLGALGWWRSC
jgi:hypothetical protein